MCGRFSLIANFEKLTAYYNAKPFGGGEWKENYNVAPTTLIPVVTETDEDGREIRLMRWGLVPHWARDIKIGASMINARAETLREKPGFKDSFKTKRCIIPASGFYEWQKLITDKKPYYFSPQDPESFFSFAGLWSSWISPERKEIETCAIITTGANSVVKPIHDRMPVVLGHNIWGAWMLKQTKADELESFLKPLDDSQICARAVSKHVNSVKNNGAACLDAA